ncbi:MAG: hypothetical protein Q7Q73_11965 [Verrucomicrobiota bacterium JB024]|nr:hypothetical protein [Verrucomicrobiota bacterium JB024]
MRYATPAILLLATALLGGCLTLQPPAITTNSVSLDNIGRRGFSFPVPPGYQASTPEEFATLMGEFGSSFTQSHLRMLKEFQQTHTLSGKSVIIYRKEAIASGKPDTVVNFTYNLQSGLPPFDRYPATANQVLAKEKNRITAEVKQEGQIISSESVTINGRLWVKIASTVSNSKGQTVGYYYTMFTSGDLNDIYQFQALNLGGKLSDAVNIVDYMAEHMEI